MAPRIQSIRTLLLSVFFLSCFNPAQAQSDDAMPSPPPSRKISMTESRRVPAPPDRSSILNADIEEDDNAEDDKPGTGTVRVRINVPQTRDPISTITLYPYPPRPLRQKAPIGKLDEKDRSLKTQLLNLGYANRSANEKAYVPGGWRWQYALKAAIDKSGTRPPNTLLTFYPWSWKMIPYLRAEVRRLNEIEKTRQEKYLQALKEFEENGYDLENQAVQRGLSPVEIPLRRGSGQALGGKVRVAAGDWWVVSKHRVPGLKFFWQLPVHVEPGENPQVLLTQTNALMIEGGW